MNRRQFLIYGSQAGAALSLSQFLPLLAMAQPTHGKKIKHLITMHVQGGWDVILGLDPQIKDPNLSELACYIGYGPNEIIHAENLRLAPPAAVLKPYARNSIVINGVSMLGNISHEDCERMAQTGIIERQTPQLVTLKAQAEKPADFKQGQLAADTAVVTGSFEINAIGTGDLVDMAKEDTPTSTDSFEPDGFMAESERLRIKYGLKMKDILAKSPDLAKRLADNSASTANPDDAARNNAAIGIALGLRSGYVAGAHVVLAPVQDASQAGQVLKIDTHDLHKSIHAKSQASCWAQVVNVIETLKATPGEDGSSTLFDETLILVTSEFSRESFLNGTSIDGSGKEHNGYTNSYLLVGGRLDGGFTVGGSIIHPNFMGRPTIHTARNFDFTCGQMIRTESDDPVYLQGSYPEQKQITPGHVVRAVADAFGTKNLLDPTLKNLPMLPIWF